MTLLAQKLQLKPDFSFLVLNRPDSFVDESITNNIQMKDPANATVDAVLLFTQNSRQLRHHLPTALKSLRPGGLLWVAYPKKSSGLETDLTRDEGWTTVFQAGYQPVRQISLNGRWSGLRFSPAQSEEETLNAQYQGKKSALRPLFEQLNQIILQFGPEVEAVIRKGYVAYKRQKQFALIRASTQTRLDVGLNLRQPVPEPHLEESPGFGSGSITHKVALSPGADINDTLIALLRKAYEEANP